MSILQQADDFKSPDDCSNPVVNEEAIQDQKKVEAEPSLLYNLGSKLMSVFDSTPSKECPAEEPEKPQKKTQTPTKEVRSATIFLEATSATGKMQEQPAPENAQAQTITEPDDWELINDQDEFMD